MAIFFSYNASDEITASLTLLDDDILKEIPKNFFTNPAIQKSHALRLISALPAMHFNAIFIFLFPRIVI
ncbi:MAG: hypothetical protein C4541_01875 [Candidatus Auribacter fodinae]|uniref:Uncharacterized protein n=1 Tax=Candidatus Auribacter fodinae TaxID=2093366 RepID=A0A3A4R8E9_9BACT|nr:MAG: hypothetical protein C4541_01875 [Candidatus Auribacter fodinae]